MASRRQALKISVPVLAGVTGWLDAAFANEVASSAGQDIFSRTIFDNYVALYNAGDAAFADYFTEDVAMESAAVQGASLVGRQEIVDYVAALREYVAESITIERFAAQAGIIIVQARAGYLCHRDMPVTVLGGPFGQSLRRGQSFQARGSILYHLTEGRFSRISGGASVRFQ